MSGLVNLQIFVKVSLHSVNRRSRYLCSLDLAEACGRDISLMCIWQGPDWAWGHVRVEALLSSRTVYGNRADVEHLRQDAVEILDDGLKKFDLIAQAVENIKIQVASTKAYEVTTY